MGFAIFLKPINDQYDFYGCSWVTKIGITLGF